MSIEEREYFLTESDKMIKAFKMADDECFLLSRDPGVIRKMSIDSLRDPARLYLTCGISYLANRGHDGHIREVGQSLWRSSKEARMIGVLTDDKQESALEFGMSRNVADSVSRDNEEANVILRTRNENNQSYDYALVLFPRNFIIQARTRPIETLARISLIGSCIRDMENGRIRIDPENIDTRANATKAHFLHEAVKKYPEVQLPVSFRELMSDYPRGIDSLKSGVNYRGFDEGSYRVQ